MNLLFDSDTMWVIVLAGLAACWLSRQNGIVSLGNGPPVSRETPAVSSGDDADPSASFSLEALFGQQPPAPVNGDDIDEFLVGVSGIVGKV